LKNWFRAEKKALTLNNKMGPNLIYKAQAG